MDAAELGRRRAADLHEQAVSTGKDPRQPYAFVLAEAKRRGLDVEKATPGAGILDGGRATYVPADGLIIHEGAVICGRPLRYKREVGLSDDLSGCGHLSGLFARR